MSVKFSEFNLLTDETQNTNLVGEDSLLNIRITPENIRKLMYPGILGITGTIAHAADTDHDITFGAGFAMDSTYTKILQDSVSMTKRVDASWAAGTGNGGMFTGTVQANTVYYFHKIRKDSDGSIDYGFDTSITATNKPAGYTYYRCVGAGVTDASANWILGRWRREGANINMRYNEPIVEKSMAGLPNTNRTLYTLAAPANTIVHIIIQWYPAVTSTLYLTWGCTQDSDVAPSSYATSKSTLYGDANDATIIDDLLLDDNRQMFLRGSSDNVVVQIKNTGYIMSL